METFTDIETIPQQPAEQARKAIAETIQPPGTMSKPETIQEWREGTGKYAGVREASIEEAYRRTSFDGSKGQICSLALAIEDGAPVSFFATPGQRTEADILQDYFQCLRDSTKGRPPLFIGHFIGGFDLRFLYQRAVICGVNPGFQIPHNGRHGQHYFDTMVEWAGFKGSISLDNLCRALGIPGKEGGLDGSQIWDCYQLGQFAEIEEYNRQDVERVRGVYRRMMFQA